MYHPWSASTTSLVIMQSAEIIVATIHCMGGQLYTDFKRAKEGILQWLGYGRGIISFLICSVTAGYNAFTCYNNSYFEIFNNQ